jgi:ParB family chromosome partitioning protein
LNLSQLAERIGKSPAYISNTVKLLELPDAITDGLISNKISEGHARALASIEDEDAAVECYKLILKEKASVRRAEELARRFKEELQQKRRPPAPQEQVARLDEEIKSWERGLNAVFHSPAKLKISRSKNQTRVMITLKGSPNKTQEDLEKIMKLGKVSR